METRKENVTPQIIFSQEVVAARPRSLDEIVIAFRSDVNFGSNLSYWL